VAKLLRAVENGQGQPEDLDVLQEHTELIKLGHTFCALAPGAMAPLQSALRFFRDDFEAHISQRRCPWK
jgi:NADH-quinone oxidoreductase subunit F